MDCVVRTPFFLSVPLLEVVFVAEMSTRVELEQPFWKLSVHAYGSPLCAFQSGADAHSGTALDLRAAPHMRSGGFPLRSVERVHGNGLLKLPSILYITTPEIEASAMAHRTR